VESKEGGMFYSYKWGMTANTPLPVGVDAEQQEVSGCGKTLDKRNIFFIVTLRKTHTWSNR
jgi:hypothetical protein